MLVPELLARRAAEDPGAVALVVHGGPVLTYAAWQAGAATVARGLAERGVQRGERVALVFDNAHWSDFAVTYVGALAAGAVAVPLGPRFSHPELAGVLAHCDPVGVLRPPALAGSVPPGPWWTATPGEISADPPRSLSGGPSPARLSRQRTEGGEPGEPPGPQDLAEILYTSGTTGTPKGVACSHANLAFHELPPEGAAVPEHLSFLHAFPVGTNAGQEVLRMPLRRRGRVAVALAAFDPDQLCAAVAEHRVTRLQLVPAMAQVVLDSGAPDRHDLTSIERLTLSSAPLAPTLLDGLAEAFPRATLCNAYALTESGTARTLLVGAQDRPGSVGTPVGGSEVRVVGEDGGDVAPGTRGEIWLRHPRAPARAYYRDPEATRAAFTPDGWLRTGDLGHLDTDGFLYLDARQKDLIISGGTNISPTEVEAVLFAHPAVADVAVFGVEHPVLGQDVAAAVVLRAPAGVRELQDAVRAHLSEHKTPHRIVVVDRLPRNASGKVLKRVLPDLLEASGRGAGGAGTPPGGAEPTPLEAAVLAIWQEALGQAGVGLHDDFFEIGGHSLAAAQIAGRLQQAYSPDLPLTVVFEHPTVAELAAVVAEAGADAPSPPP